MLNMIKKDYVYLATHNQKGFSFISMLMALTVILISVPLLAQALNVINYNSSYDELSIQQFTYFLREELGMATAYKVDGNELYLTLIDGDRVVIRKYTNQVIRQVNRKGYDVFLRDISDIKFIKLSYGVRVEITSVKGATYEKVIVYPM